MFQEKGKSDEIFFRKGRFWSQNRGITNICFNKRAMNGPNRAESGIFVFIKGFSKNLCYKRNFCPETGLKRAKGLFGPSLPLIRNIKSVIDLKKIAGCLYHWAFKLVAHWRSIMLLISDGNRNGLS